MANKTVCDICGKELGIMSSKFPLKDGILCTSCGSKLPKLSFGATPYTLEEAKEIIKKQSEPEQPYNGKYPTYVVLQVVLKEPFIGTGSGNLSELEVIINRQAAKGYRLHTMSTASSGSKGIGGGDHIQATLVFEKLI